MEKKSGDFKSCLNPMPDILVSCRGLNGENNALAVGYAGNCSYDPPMVMVGIVPTRHSYKMIKESGVFVVNLVPESFREEYAYLGSHSGKDENKLEKLNIKLGEGVKVNAPILLDCPVNIECKIVDSIMTGSHEMFIGKIEYVHANSDLVLDNVSIDYNKINLLKFR
ncbi:MAG: flavin reductase family protein [Clostridiaceae bacterium]